MRRLGRMGVVGALRRAGVQRGRPRPLRRHRAAVGRRDDGRWHAAMRVGILGGTFDPVHNGHLVLAEHAARRASRLDLVLFIPAGEPWRKAHRAITPAEHRLAMLRLAIDGNDALRHQRHRAAARAARRTPPTRSKRSPPSAWTTSSTSSSAPMRSPTCRTGTSPSASSSHAILAVAPRDSATSQRHPRRIAGHRTQPHRPASPCPRSTSRRPRSARASPRAEPSATSCPRRRALHRTTTSSTVTRRHRERTAFPLSLASSDCRLHGPSLRRDNVLAPRAASPAAACPR